MQKAFTIFFVFIIISNLLYAQTDRIQISPDHTRFVTSTGKSFFWLGDTGWLLFVKCNRADAIKYLDTRKQQGFNVIQVMVLHDLDNTVNVYGDSALHALDISKPFITPGNNPSQPEAYDFWDHVEFVIQEAAKRNIQMALVPIWGSNIKSGKRTDEQVKTYAAFVAKRFSSYPNIIWLNGGDVNGIDKHDQWELLGNTIKSIDKKHIMTFHPRGRYSSSEWFQQSSWADFNMIQSGHKDYAQDTSSKEKYHYGEDNWRFVEKDLAMDPSKPTLDGEPSYENIPHGLHDSLDIRWTAQDLRRYAYWSVFAGAAGFTYGENAVMQFNHMGDKGANFGVTDNWEKAIHAPGSEQMKHLKKLMSFFSKGDWREMQELVLNNGVKYDRVAVVGNTSILMCYTYSGKTFSLDTSKFPFKPVSFQWFDPATGKYTAASVKIQSGNWTFEPGSSNLASHDRILILKK